MDEAQLREQMAIGCRILSRRSLVEGFGHISARLDDGSVLITPRKALLLVAPAEIVRVDATGKQNAGSGAPPVEVAMHVAAYRARPDVLAIARTHSFVTSAFAAMGRSIRPVHSFGTHLGDEVPVHPHMALVSDQERAAGVIATLGQRDAVLLRGNGTLITAPTVIEAVIRAIWLEESATIQWRIGAFGGEPIYYTPEEVAARRVMDMPHEPVRAWDFEVAMLGTPGSVLQAPPDAAWFGA
jgi:ribulose-5-phosphate 4-epimerase/fuculose-1-phosphate aldolase